MVSNRKNERVTDNTTSCYAGGPMEKQCAGYNQITGKQCDRAALPQRNYCRYHEDYEDNGGGKKRVKKAVKKAAKKKAAKKKAKKK
jgi:hypothetical protein